MRYNRKRKKEVKLKKRWIIGICIALLIFPVHVFAEKIDLGAYNSQNLEETLKEEGISADLNNYKETDKQITIYMFRGKGCSHCQDFLSYVANTLVSKYGDYFKLVSFETWNDTNNSKLVTKVADFLGDQAGGVPYIVIGDKSFLGYAESLNSEIENAITSLYNSKDRYDVFEEMGKEEKTSNSGNTFAILMGNLIITAVGTGVVLYSNQATKKEILNELNKKPTKKTSK